MKHLHVSRACIVAAVVVASLGSAGSAAAQDVPDELEPVLAIVSPIAAPACGVTGSTTLLVPLFGPILTNALGLGDLDLATPTLAALGPVFIVCGALPEAPGSRCELDGTLVGIFPPEVASIVPMPALVGGIVDSVGQILPPAGDQLTTVFSCSIPTPGATPVPPAPAPAASVVSPPSPVAESTLGDVDPSNPVPSRPIAAGVVPTSPAVAPSGVSPVAAPSGFVRSVLHEVPTLLHIIQLLIAILLGLVLFGGWTTSARESRRSARE